MKYYSVKLNIFKYSRFKWSEEEIFTAKNKTEAKQIARDFISSTKWAFDLIPRADLRTLKEIK